MFDSPTNLHCSQTILNICINNMSLIPLRICTAPKLAVASMDTNQGLIPLRICTALKLSLRCILKGSVWFPYEFALLSNGSRGLSGEKSSLIPLRICTALKPSHVPVPLLLCLIPLRICTALKHLPSRHGCKDSLIPLRICTALKRLRFGSKRG